MGNINLMILHYSKNVQNQLINIVRDLSFIDLTYCGSDFLEAVDAKYLLQSDVVVISQKQFGSTLLDIIDQIKQVNPNVAFIYSYEDDTECLGGVIYEGVKNFVDELKIIDEIPVCLEIIKKGEAFISSTLVKPILDLINTECDSFRKSKSYKYFLSAQPYDILSFLADGKSYLEIAGEMKTSLDVVRFHIKSIYRTLDVNNKGAAIRIFLQNEVGKSPKIENRGRKKRIFDLDKVS
ncbi:MAG: response regulator transcription factor [Saprospiraceae bacterium]|jgi:DNA-binding NarL/FixJ family response regulator|nr:response regulator transcription factor [Saprospiraceae bacterium]